MSEHNLADRLSHAAGVLRETAADPPGARVARSAADKLERGASYLREHRMPGVAMCGDLVRRYPGATVSCALAIGFLIGAARRRCV